MIFTLPVLVRGRTLSADDGGVASKLVVRFAPGFLSFIPWVWADYWVIDLAEDYSYAVVGSSKRNYL